MQDEGPRPHEIPVRNVRSTSGARSVLRARGDVRSELEKEVHGEGHGHARDENGSCGLVLVRVGCVRRGRTRNCQRKRTHDHHRDTSWSAVAK